MQEPVQPAGNKPPRRPIYATEITGLILIALLILAITLVRYWRLIRWSLR